MSKKRFLFEDTSQTTVLRGIDKKMVISQGLIQIARVFLRWTSDIEGSWWWRSWISISIFNWWEQPFISDKVYYRQDGS